jgi:hypothetical protein
METGHQPETRHPAGSDGTRRAQLVSAAVAAPALSALVLITAAGTDAPLGAPDYWPWLLTGLQVLALWSAGTRRWWGWLLGAAVQLPWIAYAVDTGQPGLSPDSPSPPPSRPTVSWSAGHDQGVARTVKVDVFRSTHEGGGSDEGSPH